MEHPTPSLSTEDISTFHPMQSRQEDPLNSMSIWGTHQKYHLLWITSLNREVIRPRNLTVAVAMKGSSGLCGLLF